MWCRQTEMYSKTQFVEHSSAAIILNVCAELLGARFQYSYFFLKILKTGFLGNLEGLNNYVSFVTLGSKQEYSSKLRVRTCVLA